jgi:ribosome-binding ATPase
MLSIGLVGLPNAGKSTLFNLLTSLHVPAENYPFCTIEPTDGIVQVIDTRVDKLAQLVNSQKKVYTTIEFRDIAGLVKNAHTGEGLGNKFLSHIKEVDLILMVLRKFENQKVIHTENRINPKEDYEILMLELILSDQKILENLKPKVEKDLKNSKDSYAKEKLLIIEGLLKTVNENKPVKSFIFDTIDKELIKWRKNLNLLTDKEIVLLGNISGENNNKEFTTDFDLDILLESSIADFSAEELKELDLGEKKGLDNLIKACYDRLKLKTYLTAGSSESRAWTFREGMFAPECAGIIHSDFEKNFIKAEIISFSDFIKVGGRKNALEKGLARIEGKEYIMQDGDVVEFKTSA